MISACPGKNSFAALGLLAMIIVLVTSGNVWAQEPGEQLFQSTCSACHSIGGGRLVGPDLAGVIDRRSQVWLEEFPLTEGDQAIHADPDGDGVENLQEFAFSTDPTRAER